MKFSFRSRLVIGQRFIHTEILGTNSLLWFKSYDGPFSKHKSLHKEHVNSHLNFLSNEVGLGDEAQDLITRIPNIRTNSVKTNLRPKVEYLSNVWCRSPACEISKFPAYLLYSLHDRIIPRHQLARIYAMDHISLSRLLLPSNETFCYKLNGWTLQEYLDWKMYNRQKHRELMILNEDRNIAYLKSRREYSNIKNLTFFYNVDQEKLQWLIEEAGIKRLTIEKHPALLNFNIDHNLEPTRNWLHQAACIKYLSIARSPTLLMCNVQKNLSPTFHWLVMKGIQSKMIGRYPKLLLLSLSENLQPTYEWLIYQIGVKASSLANQPQILTRSLLNTLQPMYDFLVHTIGFDNSTIKKAPYLLCLKQDTIREKIKFLQQDVRLPIASIRSVIMRFPYLLGLNIDSNLRPTCNYLRLNWKLDIKSLIIKNPALIGLSLSKRIMPRHLYSVIRKKEYLSPNSLLCPTDINFCHMMESTLDDYENWRDRI